jgi:curved DNA-binding protein CbpA
MNPYQLLGITSDAGDAEIRRAYLDALRNASPDSNPERFAALNRAYESVKDERSRCRYALFNIECPGDSPLDALVCCGRLQGPPPPLSLDAMKKFLRRCAEP